MAHKYNLTKKQLDSRKKHRAESKRARREAKNALSRMDLVAIQKGTRNANVT